MKKGIIVTSIAIGTALWACGGSLKAGPKVLEGFRNQAAENATYNAEQYRNAYATGYTPYVRPDSTQGPECPRGDGWISVTLKSKAAAGDKMELKCSTYSSALGCILSDEFEKKAFAKEDGKCNENVPDPLPHLGK